jgi:hypothetical protein
MNVGEASHELLLRRRFEPRVLIPEHFSETGKSLSKLTLTQYCDPTGIRTQIIRTGILHSIH